MDFYRFSVFGRTSPFRNKALGFAKDQYENKIPHYSWTSTDLWL